MNSSSLFETERLYARRLTLGDYEAFHDMQSNLNVMKYVGQEAMSKEQSLANLNKLLGHYKNPNDGFRVWGIFRKEDDEMIGSGAIITDGNGNELGYRLREKFWRNGYGLELSFGLLNYAFDQLGIKLMFAEVDQRNDASVKILDQCMKKIKAFWNEESSSDDYYYEITKQDYEKIRH